MQPVSSDVYMQMLEEGALSSRAFKPQNTVFVTRTDFAPGMQYKCVKCSMLGLSLLTLGSFDIAVTIAKGNFWNAYQPKADGEFTWETADYVVFSSGISCFFSGALAFRQAMSAQESSCFTGLCVIASVATSCLGLLVASYYNPT